MGINTAQMKILSGAIGLREFTASELQRATGVHHKTVSNTLAGQGSVSSFIIDTGRSRERKKGARGRPPAIFAFDASRLDEARALLDISLVPGEPLTKRRAEDAERVFSDRSGYLQIRRHLLLAAPVDDKKTYEFHIGRAKSMLAVQKARVGGFARDFTPPAEVIAQIDDFESWINAYEMGVAELAQPGLGWDIDRLAEWFTKGVQTWFSCSIDDCEKAFEPLAFDRPFAGGRVEGLVPQLTVVLENLERTARVQQYVMVYALMMALARLEMPEMRRAICETIKSFGLERVGEVLQMQNPMALDDRQNRDLMLQFLEACNAFPDLLEIPSIGDWLSSLSVRKGYGFEISAVYIEQLDRISATDRGQNISLPSAISNNRANLDRLFGGESEPDESSPAFGSTAMVIWDRFVGTKRLEAVKRLVENVERSSQTSFEPRQFLQDNFLTVS